MTNKQAVALQHLRERVGKLEDAIKPSMGDQPLFPDIIIAHHVESVLRAMFAYNPQAMANAMYNDQVCPTCVATLTNASGETLLTREEAVGVLEQFVRGD